MLDFLLNNSSVIITVLGALYPPALFLLPASTANKINVGVKVLKTVTNVLEKATNTKGGLSTQEETRL